MKINCKEVYSKKAKQIAKLEENIDHVTYSKVIEKYYPITPRLQSIMGHRFSSAKCEAKMTPLHKPGPSTLTRINIVEFTQAFFLVPELCPTVHSQTCTS